MDANQYVKVTSNSDEGIRNQYTKVNFDIAITTNEEEKNSIGGKVSVVQIFSAGASNENLNKISNFNRIQFEVLISVNTG